MNDLQLCRQRLNLVIWFRKERKQLKKCITFCNYIVSKICRDATEKYQKEVEAIVNLLVDEYMKQSRGGKKVIREKVNNENNISNL